MRMIRAEEREREELGVLRRERSSVRMERTSTRMLGMREGHEALLRCDEVAGERDGRDETEVERNRRGCRSDLSL